jgi:glycerol kinase
VRALIATLDAIIQILVRNRAHRLVVKAGHPERFPQIFLEVLNRLQLVRLRRHPLATRGDEKLLEAAVGQSRDLIADRNTGPHGETGNFFSVQIRAACFREASHTGFPGSALDTRLAPGSFNPEAGRPCGAQVIVERFHFDAFTAEKHNPLIIDCPPSRHPACQVNIIADMPFVLSLDEGTTSARAALYNERGERIGMHSVPFECMYPHPGWVEQDATAIWRAQMDAASAVLLQQKISASEIVACGITNQRETTVVWDRKTGQPIAPAIVWQCRRTADFCAELARSANSELIPSKTGLVIDAYFSGSKIRWILENVPGAYARACDGELLFGNIDTWLTWKLTGGAVHVTDYSNASRTMLMDLATGEWDSDLLNIFDIPRVMLPAIVPSSGRVGMINGDLLGAEIPISGIAGDQQAALAGQACFRPGLSKNTYGTGCFALTHAGTRMPHSTNRLLGTRAASLDSTPQFAVEGSVFIGGAVIQWLRDSLGLLSTAAESEAVASGVPNTGGVHVVPAFVGLGAPHWDSNARGLICGLTRSSGKAEIVRAALESIAFQSRELIDAMEADSGEVISELRVDGGAAVNNFLMQFQADILGKPVVRPADVETTALGAAYLAGIAEKVWSGAEEVESFWRVERRFEPRMAESERESRMEGWRAAVARAR